MANKRPGDNLPVSPPKRSKDNRVSEKTDQAQTNARENRSRSSADPLPSVEGDSGTEPRVSPEPTHGARDSVGRAFPSIPIMSQEFKKAVTSRHLGPTRITGLERGDNHCYRNAILTALLSSTNVMHYLLLWHCLPDHGEFRSRKTSVLAKLAQILVSLFLTEDSQAEADARVEEFWQQFCYERDSKDYLATSPSPWSWRLYHGDTSGQEEKWPQDAHEFLTWLFDTVPRQFMSMKQVGQPNLPLERFNWVFRSQFAYRMICGNCQYRVQRRSRLESDACLVLNIPQKPLTTPGRTAPAPNLSELIRNSFLSEIEMQCDRCKKTSDIVQERKIQHAPALLMLTISRARLNPQTYRLEKDRSAVIIPESLDISQYMDAHAFGEGSKITYSLSGVVSHSGKGLANGHYVSYVRGEGSRKEWVEINDEERRSRSLSDFDDSGAAAMSNAEFASRFTPYVLFYEREFDKDVITPGRAALNVDEGMEKDEQPSHWTGTVREVTPSVKESQPNAADEEANEHGTDEGEIDWTKGIEEDKFYPPAVLLVRVSIGDIEVQLPRMVLSHLNWKKQRDVKINVKLRAPKSYPNKSGGSDHVEASLSDMQDQAYYVERCKSERGGEDVPKPEAWNKFWHGVKRTSVDLTDAQIEEVRHMISQQGNRQDASGNE